MECNIAFSRINGTVIVVRVGNEKERREIMRNKHKLKREQDFLLKTIQVRRREKFKRINRWMKEQKGEEKEIKIDLSKERIGEMWKPQNVIEREEEEGK